MKAVKFFVAISILIAISVQSIFAQSPQGFNYQAVVRNSSGVILANQSVHFRISLLQGTITGASAYTETHLVSSDQNGLVNFAIGKGTLVSGSFSGINWGNGPYFVKVELDPQGGTAFVVMSTTQLMSVPYALYAEKSGGVNVFTYQKMFSQSTLQFAQGQSKNGVYSLNYLCGDREAIHFSNSALPTGMTISHSGAGKQLDFIDTLTVLTTESTPPGIYPINLIATSANGTKAIQNLNIHVLALASTQGTYTYIDSLRNSSGVPLEMQGPFICTVGAISNNQFSIFNFGKDSITLAATVLGRNTETVYYNVAPQTISGCSYAGSGEIYQSNSFYFGYTRTCGTTVQYFNSTPKWW